MLVETPGRNVQILFVYTAEGNILCHFPCEAPDPVRSIILTFYIIHFEGWSGGPI